LAYTFTFPPQEHKIDGECVDPATEEGYNVQVDDGQGLVTFRRAKARAEEPLPAALIPGKPIPDWHHRDAVQRLAQPYRRGERRGRSGGAGGAGGGSTWRCRRRRTRSRAAPSPARARRARERPGRERRRQSR